MAGSTTQQRGPCRGIPFCEPCAREQEAYFAMGELSGEPRGLRGEPLVGALDGMRWEGWRYLGG